MKLKSGEIGRNPALKAVLVLAVLCLALTFVLLNLARRLITIDYSQKPATTVFRAVLNQPPPGEIRNLRIAGHGVLMRHTVWMSFSAPDAAIARILKSQGLVILDRATSLPHALAAEAAVNEDARALRWNDALHLPHKDTYNFSTGTGGSGWVGYIVVNRRGGEIYVVADLL